MSVPTAVETHISTLFFSSDRVYKQLKAVSNGFLDHRSRESRLLAATRELDLNRRLAPDVYLGIANVVEADELVDRMIVMRRLPADRAMSELLRGGELSHEDLRQTAKAIARFHADQTPITDDDSPGTFRAHRQRWDDSFAELDPFVGSVLDPATDALVRTLVSSYLDRNEALFDERVHGGYIIDGHGDLRADDIFCLDDGPRILDCLAFRDDFRVGDVLSDVAFLAMDLHRLGGPDLAREFVTAYCEFTGEHHPGSLAHHYVAYRAYVRCKVACLRVDQGDQQFAAVARMYHRLALDQLDRARAHVVIVGGGPGTGKTSLSEQLGDHFGWPVISSDVVRKDVSGVDRLDHRPAAPDQGIYRPEITRATYHELLRRAELLLHHGHSVVLDASWTSDNHRSMGRELADRCSAQLIELECNLDPGIARERVARRLADGWNPSDATPEIVEHLRSLHDPWPEATAIDTSSPIAKTLACAVQTIEGTDDPPVEPCPKFDFLGYLGGVRSPFRTGTL